MSKPAMLSEIEGQSTGPASVMGIINVTPDSFSGDGVHPDEEAAAVNGIRMFEDGAELVDIGGESTRPYSEPVSEKEELSRVLPIITKLAPLYPRRLSIDTTKPAVADAALKAGASIVNDVSGLRDPHMRSVLAEHGASVIVMHMLGDPGTMQDSPRYDDVVGEIIDFLNDRIAEAESDGIDSKHIMVDPGIGFGKTVEHNIEILSRLGEMKSLGKAIVVGASRKSFIGSITGRSVEDRLGGSIAAAVIAASNGANIIRAHDVSDTVQALRVAWAISR